MSIEARQEAGLKKPEEVMEILEAFDLTGSLRQAAELAGCDHKTVGLWVRAREEAGGGLPVSRRRRPARGAFDGVVLRVAGLVAFPGGVAVVG